MNVDGSHARSLPIPYDNLNHNGTGLSLSPDGTQIVYTAGGEKGDADLYVMNVDGSNVRRLTFSPDDVEWAPSWSRDGKLIAFSTTVADPKHKMHSIWVMNANGSEMRRITRGEPSFDPEFSPDGKWLVFHRRTMGNVEIFITNLDGNDLRRLTFNGARDAHPSWLPLPNSEKIVFSSERNDGRWQIFLIDWPIFQADPRSEHPTPLTSLEGDNWLPHWTPDGKHITFTSYMDTNGDGKLEQVLKIMDANGQDIRPIWTVCHPKTP